MLHPAHLVPETKKVGELLKELQKRRSHMAIVVDEHGSVTGLVTLEDLIEEIVGEIQDEYDWEERPVERMRDGSLVVEGTLSAADLRERYEVPMPESGEFETVAGFMLEQLGSVPKGGEVVALDDWRFTVVDVERNRISKVKIEKLPVASRAAAGPERGRPRLSARSRRPGLSGRAGRAPTAGGSARRAAARPGAGAAAGGAYGEGGTSNTNGELSPPTRNERRSSSVMSVRRTMCGVSVITMSVCVASSLVAREEPAEQRDAGEARAGRSGRAARCRGSGRRARWSRRRAGGWSSSTVRLLKVGRPW